MDRAYRFSSDGTNGKCITDGQFVSQLYLTYADQLRRQAYSMLHDYHRAEDAVQIVFTSFFRNRDKLTRDIESKATKSYLCTSLKRTVYNLQRDNKKYRLAEEEEDEEKFLGIEDDSYIYDAVTCKEMLDEIRMLPPQYSEVLIMRVVYNRTVPEISQLLNIDAALVRQRTHRAREILKKLYKAKKQ